MPNSAISFAPGRVELLGNHTDYNEGFVLSAAIDLGITIHAERLDSDQLEVSSEIGNRVVNVPLAQSTPLQADDSWVNYPLGVIRELKGTGYPVAGMRLKVSSTLPPGAGLSSSAAFEVATAIAAAELFDFAIDPMPLAQTCQRAENKFVGVQCGLLDQASSVFGKAHQIIQLDFREITAKTIPMPEDVSILILNSNYSHQLTGGEYNERRQQCFAAAAAAGVKSLRDVDSATLSTIPMDSTTRRRGLHITGENERVLSGVSALKEKNVAAFGQLMFASHESSRVNFENSTLPLDTLVRIVSPMEGVLGARLTGGGFGGSIIVLAEKNKADSIIRIASREYEEKLGIRCTAILTEPAEGARILVGKNTV
jgi:galactokinase